MRVYLTIFILCTISACSSSSTTELLSNGETKIFLSEIETLATDPMCSVSKSYLIVRSINGIQFLEESNKNPFRVKSGTVTIQGRCITTEIVKCGKVGRTIDSEFKLTEKIEAGFIYNLAPILVENTCSVSLSTIKNP